MIPVVFIWREQDDQGADWRTKKRHMMVPALPMVGDLVRLPGASSPRNVRAREWDLSDDRSASVTIHIALDD